MKFSPDMRRDYLKFVDLTRWRWKHMFDQKPEYDTFTFRNFLLNMWKFEEISLSKALGFLSDLKSANTRREYIYSLYDDGVIECGVYIGKDKHRRDEEANFGRGKTSPTIRLSHDARDKIDAYLDGVTNELLKTAAKIKAKVQG